MKLIVLTLALLPLPALAAERSYSVGDFERIRVVGPASVSVTYGRGASAKARGLPNAIDQISVEVIDRVLVIQPLVPSETPGVKTARGPVSLFITTPRLTSARLTGSGSLTIAEMKGLLADVSLTGSGSITVARMAVDKLNARFSGSGLLRLAGKVANLDADVKGSGSVDASGLLVADAKLTAAASGSIRITASRSATVSSSGSGAIEIAGKAACSVQNSGAGTVDCGE
jgi:Putative auto-transporter adhesin, head GIN domain